ncbi:MAG: 8-amino-7-oxononanoate synthase [Nitrospirae bacterium]|nr:8-amino-7-oxononanoate synthase [Nitrospirota bacterium]MBI3377534.1 8-amino-7-oxononanoate synthase [Nitrospirota bacterium]
MFSESLIRLKKMNLLREIKNCNSPQGSRISMDGKNYINFSSNNYLGLANHPHVIESSKKAIAMFGFGSGASRLLCGGSILHSELEKKTAEFKGTESALIFNSGYSANIGIIPAIADEEDVIFSDELNHASIVDGCRLSKAKKIIYRHKDIGHLSELIEKEKAKRKIIITDSVFSMDGDIAPLKEIFNLCLTFNSTLSTPNFLLYIDDAHGTGVLGNGKGALAHFGIKPGPWIIQMGTFSKALGSFGAFAAGSKDAIEWILNTARSFIFSTALPSCAAAASIAALEVIEKEPELLNKLWSNREHAVHGITKLGYDIMGSETPIIPVRTGTVEKALRISRHLMENGIFASAIRPPSVKEPRIRITVTAAHTTEDIERLIKALDSIKL